LLLLELLSDIVQNDDVLFIVKNDGATSEVRSNSLSIRQKEKWITIGDNDGPAHMHIDSELIKSAEFVQEEKAHRTEFSFWKLVSKSTDSNLVTLCEQRGHVLRGTVYSEYDEWIKRVVDTPDSALMITWKGYSKNFCLRCRLILKHEFCDTTTIWKR